MKTIILGTAHLKSTPGKCSPDKKFYEYKYSREVCQAVKEILKDYNFEGRKVILIGGGGGTSAVVPYVAETMKMEINLLLH